MIAAVYACEEASVAVATLVGGEVRDGGALDEVELEKAVRQGDRPGGLVAESPAVSVHLVSTSIKPFSLCGPCRARRVLTLSTSSTDNPRHYFFFFGLFSDESSTSVTVGRTSSCTASTPSSAVRSYTTAPRNSLRTTR